MLHVLLLRSHGPKGAQFSVHILRQNTGGQIVHSTKICNLPVLVRCFSLPTPSAAAAQRSGDFSLHVEPLHCVPVVWNIPVR